MKVTLLVSPRVFEIQLEESDIEDFKKTLGEHAFVCRKDGSMQAKLPLVTPPAGLGLNGSGHNIEPGRGGSRVMNHEKVEENRGKAIAFLESLAKVSTPTRSQKFFDGAGNEVSTVLLAIKQLFAENDIVYGDTIIESKKPGAAKRYLPGKAIGKAIESLKKPAPLHLS